MTTMLRSSHSRSPRTNDEEDDDDDSVPRDYQRNHVTMMTTTTTTRATVSSQHNTSIFQSSTHHRKSKTNRSFYANNNNSFLYLFIGVMLGVWYGIRTSLLRPDCYHHSHRYNNIFSTPMMLMPSFIDHNAATTNIPKSTMEIRRTSSTAENHMKEQDDGWQTIHVYHGPQQQQQQNTDDGMEDDESTKWYSQAHQDEIIVGLFRNRTYGYYIDLAANDAIELSNTYALEKYYHWNGLCIEPNPIYWYNLSYYRRRCHIVAAVIGNVSYPQEEIYFRYNAGDHGGIANHGFNNGKRWQYDSTKKYTIPLVHVLQRFRAPHVIDYMSLDVEGAETYILHNFPFSNVSTGSQSSSTRNHPVMTTRAATSSNNIDQYHIQIMTAERLRGTIRQYIKDHQYHFVQKLAKWGESLWVHENYYDNDKEDDDDDDNTENHDSSILDWSVLNKYNFPV